MGKAFEMSSWVLCGVSVRVGTGCAVIFIEGFSVGSTV